MIVAIEGVDQAGKRTQSMMLQKALKKRNKTSKLFHFPNYKTYIGKEIDRRLNVKDDSVPQVLYCLQAANRWEHFEKIKQACSKYDVVIMDRYSPSNLAYGSASGVSSRWLANLDAGLPKADIVILLDISTTESFQRRPDYRDKFEKNVPFLEAVRRKYKSMAKKGNWKIISAVGSKRQVHLDVLDAVVAEIDGAAGVGTVAAEKTSDSSRQLSAYTEEEARIST